MDRVEHVLRLPFLWRLVDVPDQVRAGIIVGPAGPLTAGVDPDHVVPVLGPASSTSAQTVTGCDTVRSAVKRHRAYQPGDAGTMSTILFMPALPLVCGDRARHILCSTGEHPSPGRDEMLWQIAQAVRGAVAYDGAGRRTLRQTVERVRDWVRELSAAG